MTNQELKQLNGPLYKECIGLAISLTKDKTVALDLVQEAYYLANKRHQTFEEGSNLRRWIKTIVYNTFVSDYRKEKRRREMMKDQPPVNSWIDRSIINNPAESNMSAQDLARIVEDVPDMYRQCFLRYVNGMSYLQIANSMNMPIGTVKSRVFTARQMLKLRLEKIGRLAG
ncbi:RNA polymerase sigma factor [Neolewinella aurantiaca]|uniref:RNA polymerase sigma factor n=1 Tax=Neolewinella aurantiaca TaxID=2602767 RepID=A0A5C7FSJ1_9BACT|nr:RNA polymerase sigma factor [Neolewinella aurantiaca]TXF91018.1 RNA polymerase sigma factor [Neolewinella aurantiaca]